MQHGQTKSEQAYPHEVGPRGGRKNQELDEPAVRTAGSILSRNLIS